MLSPFVPAIVATGRSRVEKLLMRHDLIIIDEVGFVPFSQQGANMLFTFVSQRYPQGSVLVTTNLASDDWGEVFGNALSVDPLHRLTGATYSGNITAPSNMSTAAWAT